jgi:anti-anti-sigma factor
MSTNTTSAESSDDAALTLEGSLTIGSCDMLRQKLLSRLEQGGRFAVDLAGMDECDAIGLQLLISAQESARMRGGSITFRAASPAVKETCVAIGLDPQNLFSDGQSSPENDAAANGGPL